MNNYYCTDESIKALWQEILNKINNLNFDDINAQDIIDLQNKIANLQQTVESLETLKNTVDNLSTQQERLNDRKFSGYSEFVKMVLARDNYTCQCCGTNNNDMRVHHLDGYNWCKEKRIDVTNGITL